jgi:aldehyde dehydrogenase (NAD(P)+)
VNTWSALGYAMAGIPWGGFPGSTIEKPESGIGYVHNPQLLPLVHNTILRAPLTVWPTPPWFPWHRKGAALTLGVADMYAAIAGGSKGYWQLAKMLPNVFGG